MRLDHLLSKREEVGACITVEVPKEAPDAERRKRRQEEGPEEAEAGRRKQDQEREPEEAEAGRRKQDQEREPEEAESGRRDPPHREKTSGGDARRGNTRTHPEHDG